YMSYHNHLAMSYSAYFYFSNATVNVCDVTDINNLPAPQITNSLIAPQPSAFMILARGTSIPAGTTARWTNPQQVVDDMQVPGDHVEQIDIYFPDDSIAHRTTTIHVNRPSQGGSTSGNQPSTSGSDNHPASSATPGSGSHPASSATPESGSHPASSATPESGSHPASSATPGSGSHPASSVTSSSH